MSKKTPVRVAVTGAAGQIGYSLLFRIASGEMLGPDVPVHLSLLEIEPALDALSGTCMELEDCAFPLLQSITATADASVAFKDADWALLVGAFPRKAGMERADLLGKNAGIFTGQGRAIGEHAGANCRVLVVGNPCNTNAWICQQTSGLPAERIFAMTMLDQNRAAAQLAIKAGVSVSDVSNLVVWGNHSPTMYPDFYNASIEGKPVCDVIADEAWLQGEFLQTVQQRGAAIIKARGASSAASAANAAIKTVRELSRKTPEGEAFSVCVPSDGSYGVPEGLVFSFPVQSDGQGGYQIVQGLEHGAFAQGKLQATQDELVSEREAVAGLV